MSRERIFRGRSRKHETNGGHYQNNFWYSYSIDLVTTGELVSAEENKEYTCHVACSENIEADEIELIEIKLF